MAAKYVVAAIQSGAALLNGLIGVLWLMAVLAAGSAPQECSASAAACAALVVVYTISRLATDAILNATSSPQSQPATAPRLLSPTAPTQLPPVAPVLPRAAGTSARPSGLPTSRP